MYRAFHSLVKLFISFIKTPLLIAYCYSLFVIVAGTLSLFTSNSAYAGKPSTTISFASSPDAGKLTINEINIVQGYVEFYVKETVNIQDWALYYEGQGNSSGSATLCSAPSNCTYNAGTFLVIEGVYLHNTLEELLVLDENFLAVHYFRYANNGNQGGGSWEWETDDPAVSTIYYVNGNKSNLCSKPDGEFNNANWQECDSTKGGSNEGETIDHYEIIHDGSGSTCATETVTIRACLDASCSALGTESLSVDFQVNGITISSPTFTGSTSVDIDYGFEESVSFSLTNESELPSNPLECDSGSGTSCDMSFLSSGCPAVKSCAAIFPGDLTFAVNGSNTFYSDVGASSCNSGSCNPINTFDVPIIPAIISAQNFASSSISDGLYQYSGWGLGASSTVSFSGNGTAVLYFDNSITIPSGTQINVGGDPSNLLIVVKGALTVQDGVDIKANIYVSGSATLGSTTDGANITGALSVGSALSVYGDGVYQFQQSYIDDMDSHGFCQATPTPVLDHILISHDGQGLTCVSEPLTIKACADAACTTVASSDVTVTLAATGAPSSWSQNPVTIPANSSSGVVVNLTHTTAETVTLSASQNPAATNSLVCDPSCGLNFGDAEFRFLNGSSGTSQVIANQVAGVSFPIRLQAVKSNNGVCEGLFTGDVDVSLAQENVTPDNTNPGLNFQINTNTNIAKYPTFTSGVTLNFGTDSIATIPSPKYLDAGEIRLHASYNDSGISLTGSSLTFWVRPDHFEISATSGGSAINGNSASHSTTHKAGQPFDLAISAVNSQGDVTQNYRQTDGQLQLKLTRVLPTISGSADGDLTYASGQTLTSADGTSADFNNHTITSFTADTRGVSEFSGAKYSEVGIINLDVQDINYGGAALQVNASDINIGRFTPDHFGQTVFKAGSITSSCNMATTFAYSGQRTETDLTKGTIEYLVNPIIEMTAYNADGGVTKNYYQDSEGSVNDFMKLTSTNVSISAPANDNNAQGVDLTLLPISGFITSGILSQKNLDASHANYNQPLERGVLHYKLSNDDRYYYQRSENSLVAPFAAEFDLTIASISDGEANASSLANIENLTGVEIRIGRMVIANSYGPETANLPQEFFIEHYDGSKFIVNTDDQCSTFDVDDLTLSNISLAPTAKIGSTGGYINGATRNLAITAPGAGNVGEMGVTYSSFDWLKFKWNNIDENSDGNFYDDNPDAVATFGLFRGNDRIISWREVGN